MEASRSQRPPRHSRLRAAAALDCGRFSAVQQRPPPPTTMTMVQKIRPDATDRESVIKRITASLKEHASPLTCTFQPTTSPLNMHHPEIKG